MITNTEILPPQILSYFNNYLLSTPMAKLYDDSETLLKIYEKIISKLSKKTVKDTVRAEKFNILKLEFMELYERAKTKEKELEEKTGIHCGQPFYRFRETDKRNKGLFNKFRRRTFI